MASSSRRRASWFRAAPLCHEWHLAGIDAGLKERESDPLEVRLGEATRRIGELVMENELLRKERQARNPLVNRRSSK
jgi:hypothetical protein